MDFCDLINKYSDLDLIAHEYRDSMMTYRQLDKDSDALASFIISTFGDDKTPIAVYGHKEHKMLICFFAAIKSGHPYIPIDTSTPVERVRDIIDISGTRMVLEASEKEIGFECESIKKKSVNDIDNIILEYGNSLPDKGYRVKGEDVHYIIYTSGSTGKPKGVKITSNCLSSFVRWAAKFWDFDNGTKHTVMNQAPFSFDLSVMDLYLSLYSGSRLFSIDKEMIASLKQLFGFISKSNIDVWVSTPSFAELCMSDTSFDEKLMPNLRLMLYCAETLTNSCVRKLNERFKNIKILNTYGPTEATVAVTSVEVDNELCDKYSPLPVGYIKDECEVYIVNEVLDGVQTNGRFIEFNNKKYMIVGENEKGEIVISGKSVSPGYLNNEEVTNKVFTQKIENDETNRYYRTGDEGYIENGLLFYCGRIDFQVKLNGFRIELEDIENNLVEIDFVKTAVVLPVMKENKLSFLAAVVTLTKRTEEKDFAIGMRIKEELKRKLPEYMVPRKIIIKENLPMTPNGKVNRKLLMEEIK